MKNIKQIREEKEKVAPTSDEERKLAQLVRAGLFDAKKLSILKRALRKDNIQMTRQERDTLLQLLDVLLDMITGNRQLFTKVKQSVNEEEGDEEFSMARGEVNTIMAAARRILDKLQGEGELEAWVQSKITKAEDYLTTVADHLEGGEALEEAKLDKTIRDINDLPNIIVLRRRSVRVFPEGYKVVMYWADKINRYIPIPVDPFVMTRGLDLNEATYDYLHKKYLGHIEKAYSNEEDHPDSAVHLDKAERVLRHVKKNFGNESRVRLQALGKQTQKTAEKKRDFQAGLKMTGEKGILATSGRMLKSGQRGAALGTLIGGAIGAAGRAAGRGIYNRLTKEGIETSRMRMKKISVSPLTGVRKTPSSTIKESFSRNLEEARQYGAADAALDAASFVPGPAGSAASLASAGMSLSRGDYVGAALDAAGAVPVFGYAAKAAKVARLAKTAKAAKVADKTNDAAKARRLSSIEKTRTKNRQKEVKDLTKTKRRPGLLSRIGKRLSRAAAGVGALGGSGNSSSATPDKTYGTSRRELGRLQSTSSFSQARQGDYATRQTSDMKNQRTALSMSESNVRALKSIAEGEEKTLTFRDGSQASVNYLLAKEIINIYESVNKNNKQLMANMLNESFDSFKKVSKFVVSNRK
jgi:hypothetical protein